jgi:hypothetical protein
LPASEGEDASSDFVAGYATGPCSADAPETYEDIERLLLVSMGWIVSADATAAFASTVVVVVVVICMMPAPPLPYGECMVEDGTGCGGGLPSVIDADDETDEAFGW